MPGRFLIAILLAAAATGALFLLMRGLTDPSPERLKSTMEERPETGPASSATDRAAIPVIQPELDNATCGGRSGKVVVDLTVEKNGSVSGVEIISATSPCFADAARRAAPKWLYRPKVANGQPVRSRVRAAIHIPPPPPKAPLVWRKGDPPPEPPPKWQEGGPRREPPPKTAGCHQVRSGSGTDGYPLPRRSNDDAMPILRPLPDYPACEEGSGEVVLEFVVGLDGCVRDVKLISATSECFGEAAKRATANWWYAPRVVNGKPVRSKPQRVRILYRPD